MRLVHVGIGGRAAGGAALRAAVRAARARGPVAAWIWPGDLTDRDVAAADRTELASGVVAMAEAAPVVLVRGDGDAAEELARLGRLRTVWPVVVAEEPALVDLGALDVLAIPWAAEVASCRALLAQRPSRRPLVVAAHLSEAQSSEIPWLQAASCYVGLNHDAHARAYPVVSGTPAWSAGSLATVILEVLVAPGGAAATVTPVLTGGARAAL